MNFPYPIGMDSLSKEGNMPQRLKEFTEDTLIPISLVVILCGVVIAFTNLRNTVQYNSDAIKTIQVEQKERGEKLDTILQKLGRIEYQLQIGK